jgi:hypothetical protein
MEEQQHDRPSRPPPEVVPFLTTEHFIMQSEKSSASSDTNARLQLYMTVLTSSFIALALVAQISDVGDAFRGFALVLLPTVYVFGLVTLGRMSQLWHAWFTASQGMNRIRHYFVELAPETAPYLVMPTTDDAWTTLVGVGVGKGRVNRLEGLYTAPAAVAIVNSIVAAAFVGILVATFTDGSLVLPAVAGAIGGAVSFVALIFHRTRWFRERMEATESRFPPPASTD